MEILLINIMFLLINLFLFFKYFVEYNFINYFKSIKLIKMILEYFKKNQIDNISSYDVIDNSEIENKNKSPELFINEKSKLNTQPIIDETLNNKELKKNEVLNEELFNSFHNKFNYQTFTKSNINICAICFKGYHMNFECPLIDRISLPMLLTMLYEKRLCKICFRGGHPPKFCPFKNKLKCKICNKSHNTKLHIENIFDKTFKIKTMTNNHQIPNETINKCKSEEQNEFIDNQILVLNKTTNKIDKIDTDDNYEYESDFNVDKIIKNKSQKDDIESSSDFDLDD